MTEGGVGRMSVNKPYKGIEENYWAVWTRGEEPGL